jgi:hypothetical protein
VPTSFNFITGDLLVTPPIKSGDITDSDRIRLFGGNAQGTNTDFNSTGNTTLAEGEYFFRNFTVNINHLITVNKFARIHCAGTVTINGRIEVTPAAPGGISMFFGTIGGSVLGGASGFGLGALRTAPAGTAFGGAGTAYPYAQQPFGSGGGAGYHFYESGTIDLRPGSGGDGGGGLIIEAVGAIAITQRTSEGTSIFANGTAGRNGTATGTPGSGAATGGGGGSGGVIFLSSLTSITLDRGIFAGIDTLAARGGAGGNGARIGTTTATGGGGGGGGGWVVLTAPTITYLNDATINVTGGSGGTGLGAAGGSPGGGFGAGYGGNGGINGGGATAGTTGSPGIVIQRTWKEVA